jgi:hypothetical protein
MLINALERRVLATDEPLPLLRFLLVSSHVRALLCHAPQPSLICCFYANPSRNCNCLRSSTILMLMPLDWQYSIFINSHMINACVIIQTSTLHSYCFSCSYKIIASNFFFILICLSNFKFFKKILNPLYLNVNPSYYYSLVIHKFISC